MSSPFTEEEFAKIVNAMAENAIYRTRSPENDALLHQYLDPLPRPTKSSHPFFAWTIPPPSPPKTKKKSGGKRRSCDEEDEEPVQKKRR